MSSKLTIGEATESDLEALLPLYIELNPGDELLDLNTAKTRASQLLQYPGSCILLGKVNSRIVTTCTLIVIPNLTRGGLPYALIENVVTASEHRKCGHGEAVIKHAIKLAWQHGCYKTMLMTGSKDPGTLKFYERCGFSPSKTGFQIRNGIETDNRLGD